MKVLMTADAVGGVWQYSVDLARGLSEQGISTVLAVIGPSPSAVQKKAVSQLSAVTLVNTGLPLDWMANSRASVQQAGEALVELASRHSVDIVHLNSPAFAADVRFRQPVVAVAHSCVATWWDAVKDDALCDTFKWRSDITGRGLAAADVVVAPSESFGRATQDAHGLSAGPVTVHNGRSPLPLQKRAQQDCAFTAGRLWDKGKNVAMLDKAAAELPVPLYAAGPVRGPNGDAIELEHATSIGNLDENEVARWLAARPVFVSAALYEPFGLAALEAAAAGCPLVLSDIPTFRELWDGVAAFVDPGDANAFAERISDIIGDGLARQEMGEAARQRAAQFTVEAMAGKMAIIYQDLVGSAQAPAIKGRVAA